MDPIQKVILGTAQFGLHYGINNKSGQPGKEEVFRILDQSYKRGIRYLDTAEDYGTAQAVIGSYLRTYPGRFRVISKLSGGIHSADHVAQNLEATLSALHVDKLDTYLFHNFDNYRKFPLMEQLQLLRKEGKLDKIGVSVYSNAEMAEAIQDPDIEVIQLPLNLLDNESQKGGLLDKAKMAGKEIHARSVFMQGLFFMPEEEIPDKLRGLLPVLSEAKRLSREAGVSLEALAFNYVIENKLVDRVLLGVDTLEHLDKSLDCLVYGLSPDIYWRVNRIDMSNTELLNPTNWK